MAASGTSLAVFFMLRAGQMASHRRTAMFSKSAQISRDELGQRKARGRNLDAGFTLIETLIASGVLGIVILTLFGAFFYGFSTIRASQEGVRANQLLVERLETLR